MIQELVIYVAWTLFYHTTNMAIVKIPSTSIQLWHENYDKQLFALSVQANMWGSESSIDWLYNCFEVGEEYLPIQLAMFIVSKGWDLVDYPVHIAEGTEGMPVWDYIFRDIDWIKYYEVDDKPLSAMIPLFWSILSDVELDLLQQG